jgi:sec-independent protein translocase protein TatC
MKKITKKSRRVPARQPQPNRKDDKLPFVEHFYELRRRLIYIAWSVLLFSVIGYFIQQRLVDFLLKPSTGQKFIYTSPLGGINFLLQICIYFGLVVSIPIIIYQILKYLEPLIHWHTKRLVLRYAFVSGLLAAIGAAFGYFIGLPMALHFLTHQFTSSQIQALLTIQEYMSFVTVYLIGSALLFQIPLIMLFINRIKPLRPSKLLSLEKFVVLGSFVAAAIMTPTPDVLNQLFFAVPIMLMYQIALVLIILKNRARKNPAVSNTEPVIEAPVHNLTPAAKPRYMPGLSPSYSLNQPRFIRDIF